MLKFPNAQIQAKNGDGPDKYISSDVQYDRDYGNIDINPCSLNQFGSKETVLVLSQIECFRPPSTCMRGLVMTMMGVQTALLLVNSGSMARTRHSSMLIGHWQSLDCLGR